MYLVANTMSERQVTTIVTASSLPSASQFCLPQLNDLFSALETEGPGTPSDGATNAKQRPRLVWVASFLALALMRALQEVAASTFLGRSRGKTTPAGRLWPNRTTRSSMVSLTRPAATALTAAQDQLMAKAVQNPPTSILSCMCAL